jgi:hypothetical protein
MLKAKSKSKTALMVVVKMWVVGIVGAENFQPLRR